MEVFDAYQVTTKNEKTFIKAKLIYHGLEHIGDFVVRIFFYLIPLGIIWYLHIGTSTIIIILKLILMAVAIWLLQPFANRFFYLFASTILIIDKAKNTLSSDTDKDVLALSDIKDIKVIEESVSDNKIVYKLRFHFEDGEKTSQFAFITYKLANEVESVIKDTISLKQ